MRHVDGRLSDRASAAWPGATVVKDDGPPESWTLERPQQAPIGLGRHFGEATRALGALIRAEKAKGSPATSRNPR